MCQVKFKKWITTEYIQQVETSTEALPFINIILNN